GNYGVLDQIAALNWVKNNSAAFGGDPNRILLFGESGGGTDVCALVSSPLAAGLFSSAIIQSGGFVGNISPSVTPWSEDFVAHTSCATGSHQLSCLRNLSPAEIIAAVNPKRTEGGLDLTPAGPTIDGYVLPKAPIEAFSLGQHNKVPIVIGVDL